MVVDNKSELIAQCGMNCSLCVAYIFNKLDLNKEGFHRKYCPGCIPRGLNCTFALGKQCELIRKGKVRFCFECEKFPCASLKRLDKRYRTKYSLSMIDNLNNIKKYGIEEFLKSENKKWQCTTCHELKCCHNGLCLNCQIEVLKSNKMNHKNINEEK